MPFDTNSEWKPNKKQARFLQVPFTVKEAAYLGGAGSGKSELLLMFAIVFGFHLNPKFKQLFLRRTSKQIKNEVWVRAGEIYPKFGAVPNESDMVWIFPREDQFGAGVRPSGAHFFFGHCENENDVHRYDSMEINLFTPDEITSLTEYIYLYIALTRVRSSDPLLPAVTRAAGMPGDVGHSFTKKRFIDPFPAGGKIIVGKGGRKRIFIHATQADNPHIDPDYKSSLEALPEAEKAAKLYGSWDAYLGQVFEEFRDKKYPDEPPNAIHIVEPFDIPVWWPKICAIDWGYNAMCSIGFAAISPNKRVYVYRHLIFYGKKIEEWGPEVKFHIDKDKPADIIICHSAAQHRGDPHTIQEQVSDALGQGVRLGEKNRLSGKTLMHEYLRWQLKSVPPSEEMQFSESRAAWILRNKGLIDYQVYCNSFRPAVVEDNIPRLQFFNTKEVRVICDAIKACSYVKDTKDGKKQEDVAEFAGDDPYDMMRMLVLAADQFFNLAVEKNEQLDRRAEVIKQLQESGDMTRFYNQMRVLEHKETYVGQPTMLFKGHRSTSR